MTAKIDLKILPWRADIRDCSNLQGWIDAEKSGGPVHEAVLPLLRQFFEEGRPTIEFTLDIEEGVRIEVSSYLGVTYVSVVSDHPIRTYPDELHEVVRMGTTEVDDDGDDDAPALRENPDRFRAVCMDVIRRAANTPGAKLLKQQYELWESQETAEAMYEAAKGVW